MKKNFNKVSSGVLAKIENFETKTIVVACIKEINLERIRNGEYLSWGISSVGENIKCAPFIPDRNKGRYSKKNLNGEIVVRKDLPKFEKTFSFEAPNFGDYDKGSHTVEWTKEVYHRDFISPKELEFICEVLENNSESGNCIIKIAVNEVLDSSNIDDKNFSNELLFCINLLQENFESIDVFPTSASREEYINSLSINWEILPPGTRDETIRNIISKFRNPSDYIKTSVSDRYDFLYSYNPIFVIGSNGFRRYFGAKLREDFVIFENLEYGNAVYIMFKDWEHLSRLSRTELLKNSDNVDFLRIVHREHWKDHLRAIIEKELKHK